MEQLTISKDKVLALYAEAYNSYKIGKMRTENIRIHIAGAKIDLLEEMFGKEMFNRFNK